MTQQAAINGSRSTGTVDLLVGPYRSGKSLKLAQLIIDSCYGKPFSNAIVIVPSARYLSLFNKRLLQRLSQRFDWDTDSNTKGLIGLRSLTFYETCKVILKQASVTFKIIPDQLRVTLVGKVLGELIRTGELSTLHSIADYSGAHAAIVDLMDEFERAGLSPSDVFSRLSETASAYSRYIELAKVYRQYWLALDHLGYVDQKRLAFKAREVLASGINLSFDFIAVDGFDRFNPLQLSVLHGLSTHTKAMTICFDYLPPEQDLENEYQWKQASYTEFKRLFADRLILKTLEGKGETDNLVPTATIETFRTLDRFFEMDEIARRVKKSIVISQTAPDQILVAARDLRAYNSTIDAAFEQAGLNYFVDEPIQLNTLPIVQFLIQLLNLPANDFRRPDVIGCLRSPYFNISRFKLSRQDVDRLDAESLRARVVSGIEQWSELSAEEIDSQSLPTNLCSIADAGGNTLLDGSRAAPTIDIFRQSWDKDALPGTRQHALSLTLAKLINIFRCLQPPSNLNSLVYWVSFTENAIDDFLVLPHKEEHANPFEHWQEQRAVSEFKKVLATFVQEEYILGTGNKEPDLGAPALAENRACNKDKATRLNDGSIDFCLAYEHFLKKLERAISRANFRSIPHSDNCVTICSADLAPNRNYDEVFIAGMIEGEFPRKISRSGFTSTDEVAQWASLGINIGNPRFNPAFEKALFSSLIKRARKRVYLSYPSYELSSDEIVPSFLFKKVVPSVEKDTLTIPFSSSRLEPVSVKDALSGHFWFTSTSGALPEALRSYPDCSHVLALIDEPLAVARGRIEGGISTIYNGCLTDAVAAGVVKIHLPEYWSPSRLSSYGRCPFQYWVSHVLETEPYEEPAEGIPLNVLGETCHHALELFYKEMSSNDLKLGFCDKTKAEAIFDHVVETALLKLENMREIRKGEFWQYEKQEIVYKLRRFFEREWQRALNDKEAFSPVLMEVGFGIDGESNPSLAVSLSENPQEQILIRGRIDRVDISMHAAETGEKRVRVVDYKTGTTRITVKDAFEGRNLQLPLYALAVEKAIIPGSKVIAGQYLSFGSGEPVGRLDLGHIEKVNNVPLLDHVQSFTKKIVKAIGQGNFQIDPSNSTVCKPCPHRTICRIKELSANEALDEAEFPS